MNITNKVPSEPHGTREELIRHELDPSQYGSCSPRTPTNLGCPWFKQCRFTRWKNQEDGLAGPLNTVVQVKLRQQEGGHADNKEMPCFMFYQSGLAARQKQQDTSGESIRIIAVEGEEEFEYKNRNSRSVGDPKNPKDVRVENFVAVTKLKPFRRLHEMDETDGLSTAITMEILEERRSAPVIDVPEKKPSRKKGSDAAA